MDYWRVFACATATNLLFSSVHEEVIVDEAFYFFLAGVFRLKFSVSHPMVHHSQYFVNGFEAVSLPVEIE